MDEETGDRRETAPRLSRELAELRAKAKAGTHHGEGFELTATDTELEETLAWYAARHGGTPLPEARISIDSDGIGVSGDVEFGGFRASIAGRADVYLLDGIPTFSIVQLRMGAADLPEFIRFQLEDQLNRQFALREGDLPVIVEELRLEEGQLIMRGRIR